MRAGAKKSGNCDAFSGPIWELAHGHLRRIRAPRHPYRASTLQNPAPKTVQLAQSRRPIKTAQGIVGRSQSRASVLLAPTLEPSPPGRRYLHARTHFLRCYVQPYGVQKVPATLHFFCCTQHLHFRSRDLADHQMWVSGALRHRRVSPGKIPRAETRLPRRNTRKINSFHDRNQTANAHVQFTSVNSC